MKAVKLNQEQYKRSLKSKKVDHLWVYNKYSNRKKTHNFGPSLNKYTGGPQFCIVVDIDSDRNSNVQDHDLEKLFGKGAFINGGPSPDDKEQMRFDVYYIDERK
jgi:hypothetical protein